MDTTAQLIRIQSVELIEGFRVRLRFTNGTDKECDLEPYLRGPIFEPIRTDSQVFASMTVDERMQTIVWQNGADIDPDVLYEGLTPAWMESTSTR